MEIIFLITGIVVGAIASWFIARSRFEKKDAFPLEKYIELNSQVASKETEIKNLQEKLSEQKTEIEELQKKFTAEFENIANKILEQKAQKFTEQNQKNIEATLNPLKERITEFQNKVELVHRENLRETTSLKEQINLLSKLNEQMSKEATNLTKALKGEAKTQGNWGEMILENILEKSGLIKEIHYRTQASIANEDGRRLQPDVIIHLPDNKNIIIDSKVSLVAYEKLWTTESETEKTVLLKEHINSVRKHIKELHEKNYQSLYQIKTLDFVLMFIPIEPAYLLAINNDMELWNFGYERNIILLSPTNLIPTLRLVSNLWKIENQNRNHLEIVRQSGELYDKFVGLINDLIEVGKKMDGAKNTYEEAMKKLSSGRGNLITKVEAIKKLGINTSKSIPPGLLERADADEIR